MRFRCVAFGFLLLLLLLLLLPALSLADGNNYVPANGAIPDQATALRVAEAILEAAYGKIEIARGEPFTATLKGDVWVVQGTIPAGWVGGAGYVEIEKSKGCVVQIGHR
jgi:hypothetical protein